MIGEKSSRPRLRKTEKSLSLKKKGEANLRAETQGGKKGIATERGRNAGLDLLVEQSARYSSEKNIKKEVGGEGGVAALLPGGG